MKRVDKYENVSPAFQTQWLAFRNAIIAATADLVETEIGISPGYAYNLVGCHEEVERGIAKARKGVDPVIAIHQEFIVAEGLLRHRLHYCVGN